MDTTPSHCLLCFVKVEPSIIKLTDCESTGVEESSSSNFQEEEDEELLNQINLGASTNKNSSILQRQLDVIFLLKNILQLQAIQLEKYLKVKGNPEGWIVLCGSCAEMVKEAKEIFAQIQSLSRKYDEAKIQIVERLRTTYSVKEVQPRDDFILKECRKTVGQRRVASRNFHFLHGDRRALQLSERNQNYGKQVGKENENSLGSTVDLDKTPSPSSSHSPPKCPQDLEEPEIVYSPKSPMKTEEEDPLSNCDAVDDHHSMSSSSSYRPSALDSSSPGPSIPDEDQCDDYDEDYKAEEDQDSEDENEGEETTLRHQMKRKISSSNSEASQSIPENSESSSKRRKSETRAPAKGEEGNVAKKYTCRVCQRVFAIKRTLKRHLFRVHKLNEDANPLPIYKCTFEGCGIILAEKDQFIQHIMERHKDVVPTCTICKQTFTSQLYLDKHDLYIHKKVKPSTQHLEVFDCPKCERRFPSETIRKVHIKICRGKGGKDIHPDNIFPCPHCGKSYVGRSNIQNHVRTIHLKERRSRPLLCCSMCPVKMRATDRLKVHMAKCHEIGTADYKCFECNIFFDTKVGRQRHICGKPDNLCEICGSDFTDKEKLSAHMKKAHATEKFSCDLCEFRTKQEVALKCHKATRHKIGVKCKVEECDLFFRNVKQMEKHVMIKHEKKSKWSCDQCDYVSAVRDHVRDGHLSLLIHKASQHQIGIKCKVEECNRFFYNEKALDKHMKRIHPQGQGEKERSFLCTECRKAFYSRMDLARHIQAIHSSNRITKPYKCKLCGKGFAMATYCSLHMQTHRKQKDVTSSDT